MFKIKQSPNIFKNIKLTKSIVKINLLKIDVYICEDFRNHMELLNYCRVRRTFYKILHSHIPEEIRSRCWRRPD